MFFKGKKTAQNQAVSDEIQNIYDEEEAAVSESDDVPAEEQTSSSYAFYKPDPYPKELVSVLKSMLQRLFPDTKRAYLLEAQKSDRKGYLLIVDIDSKFLKIINIYLDGETKKVRGGVPIECILYSKSGSLTEGIDPFYAKESAQSKANNLASKEFSGEIVFSEMPEFELWSKQDSKDAVKLESVEKAEAKDDEPADEVEAEPVAAPENAADDREIKVKPPVVIPVTKDTKKEEKTTAKVKPTTKEELFGILNEYGAKKSGEVSTVAMAAIKEYEFYIPYSLGKEEEFKDVDTSLPIDDNLRFKKLINPETETSVVPLFTQSEDAAEFADRDECRIARIKYKDFAASRAAEVTGFDGVLINPGAEEIFLSADHPLLG